jgi:CubicO group peptidase (beta-lactamase class C family)
MPLAVIRGGVAGRVFPGACVEVGSADGVSWRQAAGFLSYEADALPAAAATIYDLASLTKPIATASIAMSLVERGVLELEAPVGRFEPGWRGAGRRGVTVGDLLEHASGLPAWAPLWRDQPRRDAVVEAACRVPLEYAPRSQSVYSDLGFLVMGAVLERAGQESLGDQFDRLRRAWLPGDDAAMMLRFAPPPGSRLAIAPTRCRRQPRRRAAVRGCR